MLWSFSAHPGTRFSKRHCGFFRVVYSYKLDFRLPRYVSLCILTYDFWLMGEGRFWWQISLHGLRMVYSNGCPPYWPRESNKHWSLLTYWPRESNTHWSLRAIVSRRMEGRFISTFNGNTHLFLYMSINNKIKFQNWDFYSYCMAYNDNKRSLVLVPGTTY